jgi:hypothetical protein
MPRRNPEDIDLGAIKADLELLIERVSRLPTVSVRDGGGNSVVIGRVG